MLINEYESRNEIAKHAQKGDSVVRVIPVLNYQNGIKWQIEADNYGDSGRKGAFGVMLGNEMVGLYTYTHAYTHKCIHT